MTILAYPCIGGPLAGQHATTVDFQAGSSRFLGSDDGDPGGMYAHLASEYIAYNQGSVPGMRYGRRGKRIGQFPPSMVFVHQSLLKPLKRASER
jgi:hypothetical protein